MGDVEKPAELAQPREEQVETDAQVELRHMKAEKLFLSIALFAVLFLVLLTSVLTQSGVFNTFLGFIPTILTIGIILFLREYDFKDFLVWATPFVTTFLFLTIGNMANALVSYQLDVGALSVVNLILGLLVVVVTFLLDGRLVFTQHDEIEDPHTVEEFMLSIEDKCKALNFVIGRVYRTSNGGSANVREKLRIEKEWYNEFHSITDVKAEKKQALALIHKIHDRLVLLSQPEKEVFSLTELNALKRINRNAQGNDKIIDVLLVNDRDPVEHYYVGAMKGAKKLLDSVSQL